jgi:hypothetical protein
VNGHVIAWSNAHTAGARRRDKRVVRTMFHGRLQRDASVGDLAASCPATGNEQK